nr:SMI1/KNR4 family protein [Mucilaginibacter sp. L294]
MENWVQEVISKWKLEGVKLNPPATAIEIENAESILNFKFPQDFKDFYLNVNGFDGLDWQEHMFTLWPLEMIVRDFETNGDDTFVGFCDFLLASHFIGYCKNIEGIFKVYNGQADKDFLVNSFREAIELINLSAPNVY